jgi:AcrR family transcriptional regulator
MRITRAEQKEQTRRRLLEVARDVFERDGYEGASIRAIAEAAGVATGTVFLHFADKRELLYSAIFDDLEATLSEVLAGPAGRSLEAWLSRLLEGALAYYERRPSLSRVLLRESLIADPPWAERFARQTAELHAAIAARVEVAIARGEMRVELEASVFAAAWISFYMFGLMAWAQGGHADARGLVARMTAQHLAAYRVPRAKRSVR